MVLSVIKKEEIGGVFIKYYKLFPINYNFLL